MNALQIMNREGKVVVQFGLGGFEDAHWSIFFPFFWEYSMHPPLHESNITRLP